MQGFPRSIDATVGESLGFARPTGVRILVRDAGIATTDDELILAEPRRVSLTFREADVEQLLSTPARADDRDALTELVCLPSGARTSFELQKRAEDWMASRHDECGAPYEVAYRSDRILWRRGRALCIGTGEFLPDIRQAIAYFSYCERELADLEQRVASLWPRIEGDLALTHSVAARELKRQQTVDACTREAHALRLDFIRLATALERVDARVSAPAQRIVSELALQADTVDRLRLLDDGIEFAQETYDTVNDRLLEYRYFRSEYAVELVIAVILLAELAAVCVEIWQNW